MSAILYRQNEDGTIDKVTCNPIRVASMLQNGFKSKPEDFEKKEEKPKAKKTAKKG